MKKRYRLIFVCVSAVLTAFVIFCCPVVAEENNPCEVPPEFSDMLESLPEDISGLIPDGLDTSDAQKLAGAVGDMSSASYLFSVIAELLGIRLSECAGLLSVCIGLVLISAILRQASSMFGENLTPIFTLCSRLCIYSSVIGAGYSVLESSVEFFDRLSVFITASLPMMGVLYASGGNIGAAAASNTALTLTLTVCGNVCSAFAVPVFVICLALSMLSAFGQDFDLSGVTSMIKKVWITVIGFICLILTASLAIQTTVAAKADSLAMKSAKYAAGNFIPVVGGSVAGTLGTVAASVELIRNSVGICGVIIILLILIPPFLTIMLTRLVYMAAGALSKTLGCTAENAVFGELTSLYGYLAASMCICSVVFIVGLAIFAGCAAAY